MHRMIALALFFLLGMIGVLVGCGNNQADSPTSTPTQVGRRILTVYGPMGSKAAVDALQMVFENSDLPFELRVFEGNATNPGIKGVLDGTIDLMVLTRRPRPDEPLAFVEFVSTPVALFVNPSAGIRNLTRQQAAAVFSGEVTNWSSVGGADQEIVVLLQEADDSNTESMREYILQGKPFTTAGRILLTDLDVIIVADGIPGAIGYAAWAGKKYNELIAHIEYLDAITLDGVYPEDQMYPLVSEIGVVYRPDREESLLPLFDWGDALMASETAKSLSTQFGLRFAESETLTRP